MKKGMKILIGIFLVIGIGVGGFIYMQHREHEKMVQIATSEEAKKVYKYGIEYENSKAFSDGLIKTYKIDEDSLKYNPMGGLMVTVIINGKKELTVGYNLIDQGDGSYDSTYYTYSPELVSYLKEKP